MNKQARMKVDRQVKVGQLRLSGITDQTRIAEALGVSQSTISRDFAELDVRFRASSTQDIIIAKGVDVERVEKLITGVWAKAAGGDLYAIDRVERLLGRRAKLLGLDAPTRLIVEEAELEQAAMRLAARTGRDKAAVLADLRERTAAIERERKAG